MARTMTILITRNSLAIVGCVILAALGLQSKAVQAADDVGNPHWNSDACESLFQYKFFHSEVSRR